MTYEDKLDDLLSELVVQAQLDVLSSDYINAKNQIMDYLRSIEFITEIVGIKQHDGKWVHPLVGVVEGIDECTTQSDVICRLLDTKRGAPEAFKMLKDLGIEYEFSINDQGHRFVLSLKDKPNVSPVIWISGIMFQGSETVWTRLIDFLTELKENRNLYFKQEN